MILTFAGELTKMIDAGLGRETEAPDTSVAVGRYSEYIEVSDAAIATFDTNAALPLRALTVNIEPIQEGTGDPSPENVRPITGRRNVTVTRAGKNLYDASKLFRYSASGITATLSSDGTTLTFNGTATENAYFPITNLWYISADGYSFSLNNSQTSDGFRFALRRADGSYYADSGATIENKVVHATTNDCNSVIIYISGGTTLTNFSVKPQLEFGQTATVFSPYNGDTIGFGTSETIYGGTLDAVSGVMTVTMACVRYTGDWSMASDVMYIDDLTIPTVALPMLSSLYVCDPVHTVGSAAAAKNYPLKIVSQPIVGATPHTRWLVYDSTYTTAEAFNTMLSNSPLDIVYQLATPITITLTPQQLETLIGTNNVWSDGGNVSLTYTKYNYTEGY